ncbi:Uncharacterised protein [Salmonella enterica subsp. enterica serovar Bovismorbificans]|uniref:Uncharacterized protein n=1 Tax=Salmonella enterica subsp. enterica serovar Bovismorbificans TaxID=58097 RepID=A0A655BX78_SALET|nr:Uncharacterised protein [Salmonella enterica subsp. enterica serovar Bovismorbificans]CNV35127.1 Uncharacterised protein [Salmonella enterica subsp. enterica serovar Bovismorbificans]CPR44074.1 Uncharacterised protein [Salmonella enterica subsp. enterica serovar Bovismorbificans]
MSGRNWHTGVAGKTDRDCRRHLRRHSLRIRHAFFTNFLADSGRHATPADHRTNTQRQRHCHNDPHRRILNGA